MIELIYVLRLLLVRLGWCTYDSANLLFEKIVIRYYKIVKRRAVGINKGKKPAEEIIVSLTSIPKRFDTLWIVLESIMRQSYKPDRIILWLAKEDYEKHKLPSDVLKMQDRGLEIRICDNLLSHKKYFYALLENENSLIITVDDDIIYPENMIRKLVKYHNRYPDSIICHRSHIIKRDWKGNLYPYSDWLKYEDRKLFKKMVDEDNFFTTGGGTLIKQSFFSENVFNKEDILELAPKADDVWLNFMARIKGTKIINCSGTSGFVFSLPEKMKESLAIYNVNSNGNDRQIELVTRKYKI